MAQSFVLFFKHNFYVNISSYVSNSCWVIHFAKMYKYRYEPSLDGSREKKLTYNIKSKRMGGKNQATPEAILYTNLPNIAAQVSINKTDRFKQNGKGLHINSSSRKVTMLY